MLDHIACDSRLLASALTENSSLLDNIGYQLSGLVVVFVALGAIWGLLEISGFYFRRADVAKSETSQPLPPAPTPPEATPLAEDIAVVIAAAVHMTCGPNARVASVVVVEPPSHTWGIEGRRHIHSTHKVR
ncbi:MAG: OadG family transporter subunit [Opitutaceae bacterium]|nr:OadG family transporter subunit [Opitutaceae bacterium]